MPVSKNVLIVDDSRSAQMVLARYLEDFGTDLEFKVFRAANGFEGLRYCRTKKIDLILLDLLMPKMDGRKFLMHRSKNEDLKKIPVIVITSVSDIKVVKEAKKLGADAYILKPFNLLKLKKIIYETCNLKFTVSDSEQNGKSEVYITNDIIVVEIHDSFGDLFLNSIKHKLLEIATFTKSTLKRFLIMFLSIPESDISREKLYDFLTFYKSIHKMRQENIKMITGSEKITKILKEDRDLKNIEVVPTMPRGMQILTLQLLDVQHASIRVNFMKPGVALFSTVYDSKGNIVKNKNEPFSAEDIERLKQENIQKLFYIMNDDEKAIFESPFLDMTEIELPEDKGLLIKE